MSAVMSTARRARDQTAGWVKEQIAYVYGMYAYAYGFPLVMMDVTRQVMTAAPRSGEYSAPINQFHRIRDFASPDFKNVVRVSRNSLWSTAFLDLDAGTGRLLPPGDPWALPGGAGHGHVDRQLRLDRQPHHRRETRSLPDRRTPLARHAASRHRGDLPL